MLWGLEVEVLVGDHCSSKVMKGTLVYTLSYTL